MRYTRSGRMRTRLREWRASGADRFMAAWGAAFFRKDSRGSGLA